MEELGSIPTSEDRAWPRVALSILNWNGWQDTLECLESVRRLDYPNYLPIVVDNGSWNDSAEEIKAWAEENLGPGHILADYSREAALKGGEPETEKLLECAPSPARLVLIRNEKNLGSTGGNNVALHYALSRLNAAESVFLLNNDATVDRDCLTRLVGVAKEADAGIVGAVIKSKKGEIQYAGAESKHPLLCTFFSPLFTWSVAVPGLETEFSPSFFAHAAGMLIRSDALRAVQACRGSFMDERLFTYGEEVEFSSTARELGFTTVVAKRALVHHKGAASAGGQGNPAAYYYCIRNAILDAKKLLPWHLEPFYLVANLGLGLARVFKNLVAGRLASARAIIFGIYHGYIGVTGKWKYQDRETISFQRGKA
jgi:hypothetical protein